MPSLIDIRRRIRSVKNTQQITKAMKMTSAARLRKAQDRVLAARPYSVSLRQLLGNVASVVTRSGDEAAHPLLAQRPENRIVLVLITGDRGLAGAFNSNLIKASQQFTEEHAAAAQLEFELIGRKGRDFWRKREVAISNEYVGRFQTVQYSDAAEVAGRLAERYANDEIDAVYLIYNEFKSMLSQQLRVLRVLPIELPEQTGDTRTDYLYEQPAEEILGRLLPRYVQVAVYQALLESNAAEHAARMTAMDAATSNAADMIERLTLYMNRVRQASITREIIEVVSGAAALD
jgi:F-type H+-transporting ATPase subunit gamma